MTAHTGSDAKLSAHPFMDQRHKARCWQPGRRRRRDLVQNRCYDQGHEGPRHPMTSAIKKHQIIIIANALDPIEVTADKVFGLPDCIGLAQMLVQHVICGQQSALDMAGIADGITKIAVCFGQLAFIFLDIANIDPDPAIADERALIVKHRHTTDADMHRLAVRYCNLILKPAKFPVRVKISQMCGQIALGDGAYGNFITPLANHIFRRKAGNLVKTVRNEGQLQVAVHLEKPVARHLGKVPKTFFTVGKPHLRLVQTPHKQPRRSNQRIVSLDDVANLILLVQRRAHRIARR